MFLWLTVPHNMAVVRTRRGPACLFIGSAAARRTPLR